MLSIKISLFKQHNNKSNKSSSFPRFTKYLILYMRKSRFIKPLGIRCTTKTTNKIRRRDARVNQGHPLPKS